MSASQKTDPSLKDISLRSKAASSENLPPISRDQQLGRDHSDWASAGFHLGKPCLSTCQNFVAASSPIGRKGQEGLHGRLLGILKAMERIWFCVVQFPGVTLFIARGLMACALGAALLGWRGHKLLALLERRLDPVGVGAPRSLAEAYPSLPTWWVPESALGFCLAAAVFLVGAILVKAAGTAKRLSR